MEHLELPIALLEAVTLYLEAPEDVPPAGDEPVWAVVRAIHNEEVPGESDLEEALVWVEEQEWLQEQADELVVVAESRYPTPGFEEVSSDSVVFPPWHGQEWWLLLRHYPWARDLDWAVERARHIVEQPTA